MDVSIIEESCCKCGIAFWLTAKHKRHLRDSHEWFYCPSGHKQYYSGESDAEKYKRQLGKCRNSLDGLESRNTMLSRSNSALRGVITKQKKYK